jgi:hypothetical protein
MASVPAQQWRSVDPYAENRWSTVINRISRLITGGEDVIFFPNTSFLFSRTSDITENHVLDFEETDNYLDSTGGMTAAGWYYIVLYYVYDRKYPAPNAYYRIIKDRDILEDYSDNFIYLGAINIEVDGEGFKIGTDPDDIITTDPTENGTFERQFIGWDGFVVDGGVLPDCLD